MKRFIVFCLTILISTSIVYAQKYKINTKGVIKNSSGTTITSPANTTNQNYYNNYQAQNYINTNQVNATNTNIIEFVMDYSGSMYNWIGVAKKSMTSIIAQIPPSTNIGFRVFGHDNHGQNPSLASTLQEVKQIVKKGKRFKVITKKNCIGKTTGACASTIQVAPIVSANANSLISGMNSVDVGGATPLVYALDRTVYQDFAYLDKVSPKKIILITDGGENCGGDPCQFARNLMSKRNDIHIDVVLVSSSSRELSCLTQITGGNFYTIDNLSDFSNTLTNTIISKPVETPRQHYEFINE